MNNNNHKTEIIPITPDEYNELAAKGGMQFNYWQTNEDMQNNTFTLQAEWLPDFPFLVNSNRFIKPSSI